MIIPILQTKKYVNTLPRTCILDVGSQASCSSVQESRASLLPSCDSSKVCNPWLHTWVYKNMINFTNSLSHRATSPATLDVWATNTHCCTHCGCMVLYYTALLWQEITAVPEHPIASKGKHHCLVQLKRPKLSSLCPNTLDSSHPLLLHTHPPSGS